MEREVSHADGVSDFTLCGLALDAHESGDVDHPVIVTQPGQVVTCPDCRRIIDYARAFKRYRRPANQS